MDTGIKKEVIKTDRIERDVYIFLNTYKEPIEMTQGTNAIAIVFSFCDYDILQGTTANVFVKKPSGKAIQAPATVDPGTDTVTVNVTEQMTAEAGNALIQIQLRRNEKDLYTFNYPLLVSESATPILSENGSSFLDEYIRRIDAAIAQALAAKKEIERMAAAGEFSATVTVGGTTTTPPGTFADVRNTGTVKDAVFSFSIPEGRPGISTALAPGIFEMYVSTDGNLMIRHNDNEDTPQFSIRDGELIYTIS